jgi:MFS family permease
VDGGLLFGVIFLGAFGWVETKVAEPMFRLSLFRVRAFASGSLSSLLASVARGGLQFMLIIWLQGIWLPLHGYNFSDTPLWAGIFLLPMTAGFLVSGPVSGYLSDRFGSRAFATAGMVVFSASFLGMLFLPIDFHYWMFAALVALNGIGSGMFAAPNTSAIMSSVPAEDRGVASGMRATFQNAGMSISIGIFFSLLIAGLHSRLPHTLSTGLQQQGVPAAVAAHVAGLPPVATVFAAFLGYNPIQHLLAPFGVLAKLPSASVSVLTGKTFFPHLISAPFHHGLVIVFTTAVIMGLVAAGVSAVRGEQYYHQDSQEPSDTPALIADSERITPGV